MTPSYLANQSASKQMEQSHGGIRHSAPEGRLSSQFCCSSKKYQGSKLKELPIYTYTHISYLFNYLMLLHKGSTSENTEAL